ncbi:HAD-IIA family hydrolase [Bifidobacterium sp.]|jgi:HAD superfamily hydrolase (TIGR01450 family)|uniref:HAD-IIA family hydrolase n=1 Tax=Bifidobacterium sp. TaxID=41200 RepID=UPI0025C440D5|nr:HAD-IIA family hydrolase [Bifidobacterium sp.]MCH4209218.1 HAD-IIA family hydrolase [Bifidobacterium sp.]MCI1224671.1 HAD-IIA family hydrolase [Bifidobacterium sp.]
MTRFLQGSEQALSRAYQLALLDLDGVVYRGKNPIEHAADSIRAAERIGMTVEYTTNNSSRFQHVVAEQLRGFALDVEPWQIITSAVVAARMVARHVDEGSDVLVLGAEHLREEVRKAGLHIVEGAQDDPQAVIQGWYPDLAWHELAEASFAVERGATYFVTNRDLTIPRELGIAPGCGSLIQAVIAATGVEPVASAGKPESAMYDEARLLAARDGSDPVAKRACLAIGDRLDTDIEAGNRGGYDSLAVLTGVTNPHELMSAPAHLRPTYIVPDLRGLNEAQPEPLRNDDGSWSCGATDRGAAEATVGAARAWIEDGALHVSDSSDINALRAACCLAWEYADCGEDIADITLPDCAVGGADPQ